MDYPHGHSHSHHRREEDEDQYPRPGQPYPPPGQHYPPPGQPYPPPFHGVNEPPPPFPPPQVYHTSHSGPPPPQVYHTSHSGPGSHAYPQPPPSYDNYAPPPPVVEPPHHHQPSPAFDNYAPPPPVVEAPHHHPHMPHFPHGTSHHTDHKVDEFANKPSVRVYTKAETNYSLTIRNGKVILARSDPSDPFQHWIKDERLSTRVKDEEGFPSFALINKATGQAMKHATGATHPVQLIPYNANKLDESILWTESKDLGDTYRTIRMVNNIRLNVDAFNGDKNHGGVHDGTTIVLWEWKKGDNQRWKIVPY